MGKVITSPVKAYPGTVTLREPVSFPMVIAFNKATAAAKLCNETVEKFQTYLPAIFQWIEKWDLAGIPAEELVDASAFLPLPIISKGSLVAWLINEITSILYPAAPALEVANGKRPLASRRKPISTP